MMGLCEDITIDSMFVFESKVYVFRVNKYWVFELNQQNSNQPLGPLIEGNIEISSKWKGIDGTDNRFTIHNNKIVAISDNKWTEIQPNGDVIESQDILPEKSDQGSGPKVPSIYVSVRNHFIL